MQKLIMGKIPEEPKINTLTDEEIWLRAYCAALSNTDRHYLADCDANEALRIFKERFKKE